MVIVVGGIKGGSGKTTVATNLAVMRAASGRDVVLVDADRQGTASDFSALRDASHPGRARYRCVQLVGRAVQAEAPRLIRGGASDVIFDTDGQDVETQMSALALADVLLVPFVPRSFDFWTLDRVVARAEEARTRNRKLRACAFLNRVDARRAASDDADEVLGESGLEVLPARLGARNAYGAAAAQGLAVAELRPPDKKASAEIETLYTCVFPPR